MPATRSTPECLDNDLVGRIRTNDGLRRCPDGSPVDLRSWIDIAGRVAV